ncbi:dipeptidase [Mangrovivirga sp. M17]|uniref:Dipeptidase n=1 Tax=Mangrovivirga halotolerans TaxID=2993936 RepID=A0ABT3RW17_9BACT|nr:dipeptidase [Mangrovivirga halotolerans]MCX2745967.1 dipeptidase [Mangrovivirga halotolerans]
MRYFSIGLLTLFLLSCNSSDNKDDNNRLDTTTVSKDQLGNELLIVDTHIDLPYRLSFESGPVDVTKDLSKGHFDYVKARKGGLNVAFMSIYTPPSTAGKNGFILANDLIDLVDSLGNKFPDKFKVVNSPEQIEDNFKKDIIYLPLGMENGSPINNNLENLDHFYERGIRYITLCHFKSNEICDSSTDTDQPNNGLSDFGIQVVKRMNELGIMVDVSHVSDKTISDVLKISTDPIIASHSGCRALTPSFPRNLPDSLIMRIKDNGGVVMINFGSIFLNKEASSNFMKIFNELEERNIEAGSKEAQQLMAELIKKYPVKSKVSDILDHIDHVVEIAGIDYVGFGSDFDGVTSLPDNINSVADYSLILEGLKERGYSNEEISKIAGGNLMRVWKQVSN